MTQDKVVPVIRRPAVAGYFYPADPEALRAQVDACSRRQASLAPARAVVVPHGSYRHSGAIAGSALGEIMIPRRCVIVGPSHSGSWSPWSLLVDGAYRTPLGDVPIDTDGAEALRSRCPFLEPDAGGQRGEHAIETVLPFLQRLGPPDLAIVPLIIGSDDTAELVHLAEGLAQVARLCEEPVLLIASSDLSHYETQEVGARKDRELLELIGRLDGTALLRYVQGGGAIMCGYAAVACALEAAKALGATRARLAGYGTSVEAGGDPDSVIGYAGVVMT